MAGQHGATAGVLNLADGGGAQHEMAPRFNCTWREIRKHLLLRIFVSGALLALSACSTQESAKLEAFAVAFAFSARFYPATHRPLPNHHAVAGRYKMPALRPYPATTY